MKQLCTVLLILVVGIGASGCYHANVITGLEESNKTVEKKWFLGFVAGLIIPDDLNVEEDCPDGVARVETQLSFANQLVTFITGGIFSPMSITVTCAAGPSTANVIEGTDQQGVLELAAEASRESQGPVYVRMVDAE